MSIILEQASAEDYKRIRKLYKSAFPLEERAPYFMLKSRTRNGRGQMLAAKDERGFVGFAYLICHLDLVYLFYLAIAPDRRGQGCGSAILSELKELYKGRRLFLAREQLDEKADNYGQRVKRHDFYLHNGFSDLSCKIREASVVYDVMGVGGSIAPEEYDALICSWSGKLVRRLVGMKAFHDEP